MAFLKRLLASFGYVKRAEIPSLIAAVGRVECPHCVPPQTTPRSLKPYGGPCDGAVFDRRVPTLRFLPRTQPSLPRCGPEFDHGAPVEAAVRYPRARGTVNPEQPPDFEDEITLDRESPDDFTQPDRVAIALEDKTRIY